jgi:hypothetical protein
MSVSLNKRLLFICIIISIGFHAACLAVLQRHSVWFFSSALSAAAGEKSATRKQQILAEAFHALSRQEPVTHPRLKQMPASHLLTSVPLEAVPVARSAVILPKAHLPISLTSGRSPFPVPRFQCTPRMNITIAADFCRSSSIFEKTSHPLPCQHPETSLPIKPTVPEMQALAYPPVVLDNQSETKPVRTDAHSLRRVYPASLSRPLPNFPTLNDLETSDYSDSFDIDLVCLPREQGPGYLFAITLIPRSDLDLPKLHQRYFFLIDRANCIQQERLQATKNAILKCIEQIPADDTFNVFVFDSKAEKLFPSARPPDKAALAKAKLFLDPVNIGSFFSPANLYNPLLLTLPAHPLDDEVYTAILLTNGDSLSKKNVMRSLLQTWTWQNNGNVSLFTINLNSDTQSAVLDMAAAFNRGRSYGSSTMRGLKRKLLHLMKNIETPIVKNLSIRAVGNGFGKQIELYAGHRHTPHLYLDQPLVIIGQSNSPDDFILFLQGRLKDRWVNVKKTVSFLHAKKGSSALKQQWALQQAYRCYEDYVHDDNPKHLSDAAAILQPFNISPAFQ